MINDRKLDYLLKIAETRSITSAAKALYVSQPALSQFVSSLEKDYDTKIFDYENGKLTPTFTGELIIESFKQQKLLESNLQRALNDARQSKSGRITIGISNGRAPMFLSIVLPDFKKEYPHIQLTINTKSENGFESMVSSGSLDLAFVMDRADVPAKVKEGLVYEPLFDYYCLLAAPPSHPIAREAEKIPDWRKRPPVDLNDFKNEPFICTTPSDRHKQWEADILKPYNFRPKEAILLTEESAVFSLVQAGVGFALLQDYVAYSYRRGAFFRLNQDNSKATLCVIYRKGFQLSKAMAYFIDLVKEHTKKGSFFRF